jgi:PAS domain S-box-containing protein
LAAIAASAVALFTVSRKQMALGSSIASSVMMGSGIASMHYIGMEAMRLPAMMEYRWNLVALSIVLAILISWVALILAFRVRQETASLRKLLSAVLMGIAIPLMHYTGMWEVRFHTCDVAFSTSHAVQISSLSIVAITLISILAMALAIASAFLDRILAAAQAARDGEARFHLQAEAIPQIVWTAVPGGGIDYCNRRWYELTGFSQEQTLGFGWKNALHPDDVPVATENWERSHKTGHAFDIECRLRCAAGGYRWHLVRATPMRDASATITKWFGACADIEDQKHNQQILEDEIKARTEELAEANVRLHAEMLERDHAPARNSISRTQPCCRTLPHGRRGRPCWPRWASSFRAASAKTKYSQPPWALLPRFSPPVAAQSRCSMPGAIWSKSPASGTIAKCRRRCLSRIAARHCVPGTRTWWSLETRLLRAFTPAA